MLGSGVTEAVPVGLGVGVPAEAADRGVLVGVGVGIGARARHPSSSASNAALPVAPRNARRLIRAAVRLEDDSLTAILIPNDIPILFGISLHYRWHVDVIKRHRRRAAYPKSFGIKLGLWRAVSAI
jgi:hypothetical protein